MPHDDRKLLPVAAFSMVLLILLYGQQNEDSPVRPATDLTPRHSLADRALPHGASEINRETALPPNHFPQHLTPQADAVIDSPNNDEIVNHQAKLQRIKQLETRSLDVAMPGIPSLLIDGETDIRLATIKVLSTIDHAALTSLLIPVLLDPNPQVREQAVLALSDSTDPLVTTHIEPLLYDEDKQVRIAAIETLGILNNELAVAPLASLLSDPDDEIRLHAVNALAEIEGVQAVQYLLQARYDSNAKIRANVEFRLK